MRSSTSLAVLSLIAASVSSVAAVGIIDNLEVAVKLAVRCPSSPSFEGEEDEEGRVLRSSWQTFKQRRREGERAVLTTSTRAVFRH
jgi:hypothetical protein